MKISQVDPEILQEVQLMRRQGRRRTARAALLHTAYLLPALASWFAAVMYVGELFAVGVAVLVAIAIRTSFPSSWSKSLA